MYPSSPFQSTLNTSYITGLDMCAVCTEAVHSVALPSCNKNAPLLRKRRNTGNTFGRWVRDGARRQASWRNNQRDSFFHLRISPAALYRWLPPLRTRNLMFIFRGCRPFWVYRDVIHTSSAPFGKVWHLRFTALEFISWKLGDFTKLVGGFKYVLFHPYLGKLPILANDSFLSMELKPPTSKWFYMLASEMCTRWLFCFAIFPFWWNSPHEIGNRFVKQSKSLSNHIRIILTANKFRGTVGRHPAPPGMYKPL